MSAVPPSYDRQASFTSFQTPDAPATGADLEAEFNRVKLASDATQARLAEIQRDDGLLKNLSVHPDALSAAVRALLTITGGQIEGAWATGVSYDKGDVVEGPNGVTYIAAVAHLSNASFDVDLSAGHWLVVSGDAGATVYTPPSTGVTGTVKGFLDALWSTGANLGAKLIRWIHAGAGAVARTVEDRLRDDVSAEDFGAAGDGLTNDLDAINAAITAVNAAGGGVVNLTRPTYRVTGKIALLSGVTLRGKGIGATEIVLDGSPDYVIEGIGSVNASVALTADAAAGATTLTMSSTAGLAAGNFLLLTDGNAYNPNDATYRSGELVQVFSVDSGTQVTLYAPVKGAMAGSYTTANSSIVRKVNMLDGLAIEGLTVTGDQAGVSGLVAMKYARDCRVQDVRLRDGGHYGLRLDTVFSGDVSGLVVHDLLDEIGSGHVGYGIVLAGANDGITIRGCHFARCRHAVTTIGGPDGFSRRVTVDNCMAVGTTAAGFDTHAAGDSIMFSNCQVHGSLAQGIQVRSINTEVVNCYVSRAGIHGITAGETLVRNMAVRGCTVEHTTNHGFTASSAVAGLVLAGNIFRSLGSDGIRITSLSDAVQILDNYIESPGTLSANRAGITSILSGVHAGRWLVARNFIRADAGSAAYGIFMGHLTDSWAVDNKLFGTFSSAALDLAANTNLRNDTLP